MKPYHVMIIASGALLLAGCSRDNEEQADAATSFIASTPGSDTNAVPLITLDQATQARMNLETGAVTATNIVPEVQAYGSVLNPAQLSALVSEWIRARATADASKKELARIRTLAGQNNASARALETAEAAATRDEAAAAALRQNLSAQWGRGIAGRTDLPAFVESLATGETVLVQLSLPAGAQLAAAPAGVRIVPLTGESVEGTFMGPAATVDPELQGQSFLVTAPGKSSLLKPGAAVSGWLQSSTRPIAAVGVPESAMVRYKQKAWVYVQTKSTNFTRTPVALTHPFPDHGGWFITDGLSPGDRIVIHGAQSLLSEELKSQIQLED